MFKGNIKTTVCTFMVGVLLGIIAVPIYAAYAESPWGYYGPHLGYLYKNQARVSDDVRLYAGTGVYNQDTGNVPTGYMGVKSQLFKSDELYRYTDMWYNDSPSAGLGNSTLSGYDDPSGTYYSKGITAAYNGNGYTNYYTFQSPSINH